MLRYHATGPPLTYPHCDRTVTVYHTMLNPFSCRRTVLQGVYYETRRSKTVNEDGARRSSEYLLIIPQKTAARVMPGEADDVAGTYVLMAGDRVVAGVGPEIATREEWSKLLPNVYDVVTVNWVEQKFWHGEPCHVEAGA